MHRKNQRPRLWEIPTAGACCLGLIAKLCPPSQNSFLLGDAGTDGGPRQNRGLAHVRETENGNAGAGGRKREHPAQITTALDYLSWEYALLKAGRTSRPGAAMAANSGGGIDN